jgi:intracellular sulfur oxidation DsrE/DsrF family protein
MPDKNQGCVVKASEIAGPQQESNMNNRKLAGLFSCLVLSIVMFAPISSMAQEEKPFAEHKFVLQISDMDPSKQTLVLNVAGNILKAYGQDQADVEIVAFGPGLRLLFEENSNSSRIDGLAESGVRFFACQNTINNMSKIIGEPVKINSHAASGKGGIVRIKELVDQGYMLAKP